MASNKLNLAIVGSFVLLGLVSLIVALAVLSGRSGPTDRYYTTYSNVSGLKFGSQVFFEGYPVGQVEKVEPYVEQGRMQFRVELSVIRDWKIPLDSVARSESSGVLAPQSIAISAGKSPSPLEPGDMIKPGETAGLLASISSASGNFDKLTAQQLVPLLENLNKQISVIGSIVEQDIKPLAHNANIVVASGAQQLPQIFTNANNAMTSLRSGSTEFERLTKTAGPDLITAVEELRITLESFSRHSESLSQNLESASRNLQEFSRQIRQNPSALLRSPDSNGDAEAAAKPGKR